MSKAECGCKIVGGIDIGGIDIRYCPLHSSAGALRDACKAAQERICHDNCGGGFHDRECSQLTEALRQAGEDA